MRQPLVALVAAAVLVGAVPPDTGSAPMAETAAAASNTATVLYYTKTKNWPTTYLHYAPDGGSWTTVPGTQMESACTDWVKKTVDLGSAAGLQATFNNGSGTWDNNGGGNYALGTGTITVRDGVIAHSDPCADTGTGTGNQATVYYSTATSGWTTANIHYAPTGGSWTTAPGVGMETACTGWWKKTLDIGTATSLKAAFNNGNGVWDNNNSADYTIQTGSTTVMDRAVTNGAADPCAAVEPDTEAPTAPTDVTASATNTSVVVSWDAATDNTGVTKYQVTRTGGTQGTVVTDIGSTVFSDTGLEERTTYTYTVKAVDAAGNTSPASAAATATTGDQAPAPASGTPLGTDPRKDPIYFVLTARFYDGDTNNDRGGSQHTKSGNAANNDPMFRGDFNGLVENSGRVFGRLVKLPGAITKSPTIRASHVLAPAAGRVVAGQA